MYKLRILISSVVLAYILFVVFQFGGHDVLATNFRALMLPLIALVYFLDDIKKTLFFTLFLIFYAISDFMILLDDYISHSVSYYLGNSLYILAYVSLILENCKSVCLSHILRNFKLHLIVLIVLNVYIVHVLLVIVDPYVAGTNEYYIELIYNIVMLILLSMSLLNYFYRDNKKAFFLFIGSLSIVFSEVIGIAYIYVTQKDLLSFLSTTLGVLAFYFFYQQSKLDNKESQIIED